MIRNSLAHFLLFFLALTLVATPTAHAGISDLSEDLPLRVEDARTTKPGIFEAQLSSRYEDLGINEDAVGLDPSLQVGLLPQLQGDATVPVLVSNGSVRGSGDFEARLLYAFVRDIAALSARVIFPTGKESAGLDSSYKLILSPTLWSSRYQALLNVILDQNSVTASDERDNRYTVVAGLSLMLDKKWLWISDVFREQEIEKGQTSDVFEMGFVHEPVKNLLLTAAGGFGLNETSPDYLVTVGLQYSFGPGTKIAQTKGP